MTKEDLSLIFIRAQNEDGAFDSYSLQELLNMGKVGQEQVANWLIMTMATRLLGFNNGQEMTEEFAMKCVEKMDALGVTIVRANPKLLEIANMNDPLKKQKN